MKSSRVKILIIAFVVIIGAGAILLSISSDSMTYYYTPGEVLEKQGEHKNKTIRVMGLVAAGSVEWKPATTELSFDITETGDEALRIVYIGAKPDMFREAQGIVAEGKLTSDGILKADQLLVKHSEEYKVEEHATDAQRDYQNTLQ